MQSNRGRQKGGVEGVGEGDVEGVGEEAERNARTKAGTGLEMKV